MNHILYADCPATIILELTFTVIHLFCTVPTADHCAVSHQGTDPNFTIVSWGKKSPGATSGEQKLNNISALNRSSFCNKAEIITVIMERQGLLLLDGSEMTHFILKAGNTQSSLMITVVEVCWSK